MEGNQILREQLEYYRARAHEYDEWFLRKGRYDRGPEQRAAWFNEVGEVQAALNRELQSGEVLELACGTGLWTQHLARLHSRVVAVDASPEVIEINRQRVRSDAVEYVVADLFGWQSDTRFDAVFFGFWLSHVPQNEFVGFWAKVGASLKPKGRVFFVDSLLDQASTARDHAPLDQSGVVQRRLNDGREYSIVKVFYEPADLERRLVSLGWRGWVRSSGQFFLYGSLSTAG
ncbi:MAG TPA: class I SAM-dependent methyltransferase [Vicinamibacterales bacterium]|jgi:demethylmenaquinone methyltransferase/2-methoxy-6-polyprenyl-1,4-benzoquinol methylase